MKRELASAINHLDTATKKIGLIHARFEGVHDDYAELLILIAQSMQITQNLMRQFWLLAWGKLPDNIRVYIS